MSTGNASKGTHAVVMGGSMAGLLAARVLVDHFELVTLVDRDELPSGPAHRRGVPQSRHSHGLLASGRRVLEDLFPGIADELAREGAIPGDMLLDSRWYFEGGHLARADEGLAGFYVSRPLLESVVRRRVLSLPRLASRQGCRVDEPVLGGGGRVVGVRIGEETVRADLVVDATGRVTRLPEWLESKGYPAPQLERVAVGLSYTTRVFRREPGSLGGDLAAIVPPTPLGKRGGVLLAQEDARWTVTLISHFGPKAPEDVAGFREFARGLPSGDIYEAIRDAEPLGDAASASFPASVRRRYEALGRFPAGLLVVGDGLCSFNPIYGQGMSVAALEAMELARCLREEGHDLARRFFARAAKVVDVPWSIAVGSDLRIAEVEGPRSLGVSFINWYIAKLHRKAHRDPVLSGAFMKVANLLAPPPSILHPRLAARVFFGPFGAAGPHGAGAARSELAPVPRQSASV
jgi:2-polyprenyl-6-methoxyphenol hydroxylase-like FAD-dependent oxidoreductase